MVAHSTFSDFLFLFHSVVNNAFLLPLIVLIKNRAFLLHLSTDGNVTLNYKRKNIVKIQVSNVSKIDV